MAILFDAIVQDGTYTTDDNLTKPYWRKVGIICDTRNGGMAMKIEVGWGHGHGNNGKRRV